MVQQKSGTCQTQRYYYFWRRHLEGGKTKAFFGFSPVYRFNNYIDAVILRSRYLTSAFTNNQNSTKYFHPTTLKGKKGANTETRAPYNNAVTLRRGPVCSCGFRISAASEQAGRCGPGTG